MKKLIWALVVICIVSVAAIYFLIPKTLIIEEAVKLPCVPAAAFRTLSVTSGWNKWWPSGKVPDSTVTRGASFIFLDNRYSLSKKSISVLEILVDTKKETLPSELHLLSIPTDSTLVRWQLKINAGNNPFRRMAAYTKALSLKKDMHTILASIQTHLSDFVNVYGVRFYEGPVTDTLLITTKSYTDTLPSVDYVYSRIDKLQNFCSTQGCHVTGTPMLNVMPKGPGSYQVMLALPVDRLVPPKDSVFPVKLVGRKFIIADVTGGPQTIAHIHEQLRFYFQDYTRMLMAIPFDYLITNRQKETDTSKWKTRIYAPVY